MAGIYELPMSNQNGLLGLGDMDLLRVTLIPIASN